MLKMLKRKRKMAKKGEKARFLETPASIDGDVVLLLLCLIFYGKNGENALFSKRRRRSTPAFSNCSCFHYSYKKRENACVVYGRSAANGSSIYPSIYSEVCRR